MRDVLAERKTKTLPIAPLIARMEGATFGRLVNVRMEPQPAFEHGFFFLYMCNTHKHVIHLNYKSFAGMVDLEVSANQLPSLLF